MMGIVKRLMAVAAITLLTILSVVSYPVQVHAQEPSANETSECSGNFLGLPAWHKYLSKNDECDIDGPSKEGTDQLDWPRVVTYVGIALVEILLRIAGLVAVVFVIVGGFRYITSQGEPENTKSARQTIQNGVIGLVIAMVASGIVAFIGSSLT